MTQIKGYACHTTGCGNKPESNKGFTRNPANIGFTKDGSWFCCLCGRRLDIIYYVGNKGGNTKKVGAKTSGVLIRKKRVHREVRKQFQKPARKIISRKRS